MRWYKRLGALLLAAVLILGLCQIPGGEVEAATNFTIKNIEFTSKEITGGYDDYDHDDFVIELSDTPIIWDKRNNEMYLVYKTLPDTSGLSAEDEEGIYFDITDGVNVETDPDGAFGEIFIFVCANPELSFWEIQRSSNEYVYAGPKLILVSEDNKPNLDEKFEGNFPQITSFKMKDKIKNLSVEEVTITQNQLTSIQLENEELLDAGIIDIRLERNLSVEDAVNQVGITSAFYDATIRWPDSYTTAKIISHSINWKQNSQDPPYLELEAIKADGTTKQTFRYKVNLNIAAYLYTLSDRSFLDIGGISDLRTNIESRVDNEAEGVMTIKTRKYLSGLSRLPVKPHYAAGAFMVPDSIIGGTLNKDGSITPKNLNTGLRFTIQNAMGDQKPYSIQVVTPWALQWKDSDNSQIKNVLKDGVVQERTFAATYTVETLDAGSNVEVQLTATGNGKSILDKVVLKKLG